MDKITKFDDFLNESYDLQDVCDDCCDDLNLNNQYIGMVFQWLKDNDYVLTKND